MPLFEVAIIEKPSLKEIEDDSSLEKLIFGPVAIIARNPESAGTAAIAEHGIPDGIRKERIEVLVRPFR